MSSGASVSTYSWTCPNCGRLVPQSVQSCRCGYLASGATLAGVVVHADDDISAFLPEETTPPAPAPVLASGTVTISHEDLAAVADAHGLSAADADRLWNALHARGAGGLRFDAAHVAYYVGALIVIAAMGFFMTLAWSSVGGL